MSQIHLSEKKKEKKVELNTSGKILAALKSVSELLVVSISPSVLGAEQMEFICYLD